MRTFLLATPFRSRKTLNMVEKTYADDAFGSREEFGDLLYAFLQSEHILADESFVVALTGGFGSGKSHFLSMWESKIKAMEDPKPMVVHVNAWESDHSGEPVLAIVSAIAKQLNASTKLSDQTVEKLKAAAAGVVCGTWVMAKELAYGYLEEKTGVAAEKVFDAMKDGESQGILDRAAKKLFSDFESRQSAIGNMTDALKEFVGKYDATAGLKLIIVVDELDRCRPTYAIDMLEALKHLFNVKGLGVLLAVDWEQLSCTASALFGTGLNTTEYFRKFVSRKIALPEPGAREMVNLVGKFWEKFISSEFLKLKERGSLAPPYDMCSDNPASILMGLGITKPRQAEDFFRLFSHLSYFRKGSVISGRGVENNLWTILFLAGIYVIEPEKFNRIFKGEIANEDILKLVFPVTRGSDHDYFPNRHYIEAQIIDNFVCKSNAKQLEEAFRGGTSDEEIDYRKRNLTLPYFSDSRPEPQIIGLARHIYALKSFSER